MLCFVVCRGRIMAAGLKIMGRAHIVRPVVAALLLVQNVVYCSSQPLPVLPLNRFGTKNTYNNTYCRQDERLSQNVEETEFCCPPVQVADFVDLCGVLLLTITGRIARRVNY